MHTGENGLSKLSKSTRGNANLCNWLDHVNSLYYISDEFSMHKKD